MRLALALLLTASAFAQWQSQTTHTTESLRGLSVFKEDFVWASGTHGTYLFTTDGGKTWTAGHVSGAESLDFRGVVSFGADAFLLAAGPGNQSRIYYSRHLGDHWDLQFTNQEPKGFLDCMAFFPDQRRGLVVGDPVNGKFQVLRTEDAGANWRYADPRRMPPAVPGEGAFAASNSCLTTQGKKNAWFVTGGSAARVFRSTDGGRSWRVSETPILHGAASAGVFSVAFQDARHGVIAGGDYAQPELGGANLATSKDGGRTWNLEMVAQQKFFSAIVYLSSEERNSRHSSPAWLAAVGSSASVFSETGLRSWQFVSPAGFNAVAVSGRFVYAAGSDGRVSKAQMGSCGTACE